MTVERTSYSELGSLDFWRSLCPNLTVSDLPFGSGREPTRRDPDEIAFERDRQRVDGHLRFESIIARDQIDVLSDGVRRLVEADIPTPFLFVYDEVWQLFETVSPIIEALVGPGFMIGGDLWVWNVPAGSTGKGWAPHRDDQFADRAIGSDGQPNLVSLWISLTDATVDNGCMYVLPKNADPNLPDAPKVADIPRDALSSIRAQPVAAGSLLSWTADVLHWGSRSSERATGPRKSLCLYAQRADVEPFTTDMIALTGSAPLQYRLGFIARTMIRYRASTLHPDLGLSDELMAFCDEHERRLQQWVALMAKISPRQ